MKKSLLSILSILSLGLLTSPPYAQAVLVDFSLTGYVDTAVPNNDFNLSVGDAITFTGTFDDATMATRIGLDFVEFGPSPPNVFTLTLGSWIINSYPADWSLGYFTGGYLNPQPDPPRMYFDNGSFYALSLQFGDPWTCSSPCVGSWDIIGAWVGELIYDGFQGHWDLNSYVAVTAIPEPEIYAMLLAGLGVLGWVGRRKKLREWVAA